MLRGEWDLANKLFQWSIPSRFTLIVLLALLTFIITIADWTLCFKWYFLFLALVFAFVMALPEGEINRRFRHAIWVMPYLILKSVSSLLLSKLPKRKKKTNHEDSH